MWAKLCMNRIMHMYIQVICIWSTFAVQYVHIIYQSFVPVCYENPSFQELRTQLIAHNGSVQHLPLPEDMKVNSADGFGKFSPEEIQKGMGSFKRWKGENGWNKIELQWSTEEFAIFLLYSIHMFEVRAQQHWWATVLFFFQMWFSCQVGVQIHIYTLHNCIFSRLR